LDLTIAIQLNPDNGKAYFARGFIKWLLKDDKGGCLDMSKAGELGEDEANATNIGSADIEFLRTELDTTQKNQWPSIWS